MWIGVLTVFGLVLLVGAVIVFRLPSDNQNSGGAQTANSSAAAPAPAAPSAAVASAKKYMTYWPHAVGAFAAIIALILLFPYLSGSIEKAAEVAPEVAKKTGGLPDLKLWLAGLVFVGFAIAGTLGKLGSTGKWARNAAAIFIGGFLLFSFLPEKVQTSWKEKATEIAVGESSGPSSSTPATTAQPSVKEEKMVWDAATEDGTLPVGIPSETYKLTVGCSLHTDYGNGTLYQAEYKWAHEKDWKKLRLNQHNAPGDEVRYTILEAGRGMKTAPISIRC